MRPDRDKRHITDRTRDYAKEVYHKFIDCSKAFESVKAIVFSIIKYNYESCRLRKKQEKEDRCISVMDLETITTMKEEAINQYCPI